MAGHGGPEAIPLVLENVPVLTASSGGGEDLVCDGVEVVGIGGISTVEGDVRLGDQVLDRLNCVVAADGIE